MNLNLFFVVTMALQASAVPSLMEKSNSFSNWRPAGPGDVRAPCPMMNTLANHGFINHDGKNITEADILYALPHYLSMDNNTAAVLFQNAITTVPTPNATSFNLDDLSRHNILEHDGSLSRLDYYFGDNHDFNLGVYDQTKKYFTSETIDIQTAANARLARVLTSNLTNPTFGLSQIGTLFSFGETAAYIAVFGDGASGTVNRSWINYFFENERLPVELGWSKRQSVSGALLGSVFDRIRNATGTAFPYPVTDVHLGARKSR